jgi:peroxiredoxin|tara:strand:+ start:37 stop:414 length:378 start_codon:yes stop_codon:yes gene_type:complete
MVYLDQINNHYKNIGLKVLAINVNNPKIVNKVKPYVKKRNFKFDVAIDPETKIASALKVEGLPTTFFIDTDGKIWDRIAGFGPGTEKDYIKSLEKYFDINHIKPDPISFEKKTALNKSQNINIEF